MFDIARQTGHNIDYIKVEMKVGNSLLPCWMKDEAETVCAVHATEMYFL